MNICFLIPSLVAGGAERVVSRMANYWGEQHDITIITFDQSDQKPFYKLEPQVCLIQLDLKPQRNTFEKFVNSWKQIVEVRRQINIIKPEVVIAFLDTTIFVSIIATRTLSVKVIVSERNNPYHNDTNPIRQWINNKLYYLSDQIVLQTQQIAETFPGSLQSKIKVVPNPVPPFPWKVTDYEKQHAHKIVIAIGRLSYQKGFDVLIAAFAKLISEHQEWQLHIVGIGNELASLQKLCSDLGVTDHVMFLGQVEDITLVLQKSSFFVLSSRFEGFPNALCEAMAVGLPVIATQCQFGPEEITRGGQDGLLVPVDDPQKLSEAMRTLIINREQYAALGAQAYPIHQRFSIDTVMQQWEDIISSL